MRSLSLVTLCLGLIILFPKATFSEEEVEETSETSESKEEEIDPLADDYTIDLQCNRGLLNSYGIDGRLDASREEMVLCPDIKYSCCSALDELKYHKNWFAYYYPKLKITHERMVKKLKNLSDHLLFFKEFDFDEYEILLVKGKHDEAKELMISVKKMELDPELKPILDEFDRIREFDENVKKGAFCMICNYENHEYFGLTGGTLLMKDKYCLQIIDKFILVIKTYQKLLHPMLLVLHKFLEMYAINYYDRKEWDLVKKMRGHMDIVQECFPKDESKFDIDNCRPLCNKYNFMEMPQIYFGEFKFYDYFMKRSSRFREWLELAKENPKDFVEQPLVFEENKEEEEWEEGEGENGEETVELTEGEEEEPRALSEFERFEREKMKRKKLFIKKRKAKLKKKKKIKLRLLSRINEIEEFKMKEKMNEVEETLKGYKHMVHKMKKQNKTLLNTIYKKSQKLLKSKSRRTRRNKINSRQVRKSLNEEQNFFMVKEPIRRYKRTRKRKVQKRKVYKQEKHPEMKIFRGKKRRWLNTQTPAQNPPQNQQANQQANQPANQQTDQNQDENAEDQNKEEGEGEEEGEKELTEEEKKKLEENVNCKECDKTIGSHNCTDVYKSEYIMRSQEIKFSKYLNDSSACTNCSFSNKIFNSTNITHSNNTHNSSEVSFSNDINNSTNIHNSTEIKNSTNVTFSSKINNSWNVTESSECEGCFNCKNCTQCKNVTNCTNCFNVSNSINVLNATHGDFLFNSTDIFNGKNLTNATNMTNASDCIGCENNYDCVGIKCMIHRISGHLKEALDKKVSENTMRIIKRIYYLTRVGDIKNYKENEDLFDRHLFRANNYLFDLARYKVIFDSDGFDFDYQVTNAFDPYSTAVFKAAYGHFTKNDFDFKDTGVVDGRLSEDEGFPRIVVDLINDNADFMSVHDFLNDANKGVISYASLKEKDDAELEAYDHYLHRISREEDQEIICKSSSPDFKECLARKNEIHRLEEAEKMKNNEGEGGEEGQKDKDPEKEENPETGE